MDNEAVKNIALFVVALIVAVVGYFKRKPPIPDPIMTDPIMTSIGLGWLEREQTERMLKALDDQASALKTIAKCMTDITDQRSQDMAERIDVLMKKLDSIPQPRRR